jgi:DNA-binding transcriptional MerR regulator
MRQVEKDFPDGLTSVQVVDFFAQRGLKFSEATFRKYVQQGLLPRSRRVGRKGKHQGSMGLYPPSTVRRINAIKQLQAENYTIEDIQRQFIRFKDEIDALERSMDGLFGGFERELSQPHFDASTRKTLKKDVADARRAAGELVKQLESIERRMVTPTERPPGGGAPGGAEDLL